MGFELAERPDDQNTEDLEAAVEALADYVITELGVLVNTALAERDCRLGNHALLTLARLGGFVPPGRLRSSCCKRTNGFNRSGPTKRRQLVERGRDCGDAAQGASETVNLPGQAALKWAL
jgi:hypothetical protein